LFGEDASKGFWIAVNASPWICAFTFGLYRIYGNKGVEDVFKPS
jgi:hypothetical protein